MRKTHAHRLYPALLAATLLVACGGGGGGNGGGGTSTITGTAATGQAMTGGTVALSCGDGLKKDGIAIGATGTWSTTVPTASLPCAVKASDGSATHYSFTVGNGSSIVTNVTPLTTLALAQILAAVPESRFASLSATDLARLTDAAIHAAIGALNSVLAGYALPAGFNPVTTPLTAAATGQTGNDHDRLLDQFGAANPDLDALVSSAATGTMPTLAAPGHTPGATSLATFFETFAGDYTLTVTDAGAEGATNATAQSLFPKDSARVVRIKPNGDVVIEAAGKSISWAAATYTGSVGSAAWSEFDGSATTQNTIRYRRSNGIDLYITYDPATGKLEVSPQGFIDTGKGYKEGYATLKGTAFVPPPAPPAATCSAGDDKLVFTGAPPDFCGFTRNASGNNIPHYYQFTSAPGSRGVTYVKFDMSSDDSTVTKVTIENDAYAFGCGGALPACSGVTVSTGSSHKQFTLSNTPLAVINGSSQGITVSGLLIHPAGNTGGGSSGSQSGGISFSKTGTGAVATDIGTLAGTYTGTIGRVFNTGAATVDTTSCTITVTDNGDITVASGGKSVTARVNGDTGDVITGPINVSYYNVQASDNANNRYAQVTTVNGYVTAGVARNGGFGFSDATDRVECKISNPNVTTAGTLTTVNIPNGATAANIDSSYVGTFSNGSCTLTVSAAGVLHLVTGTADVTTSLAGDAGDTVNLYPTIDAVAMRTTDFFAGGKETYIEFMRSGTRFVASARTDQPRPVVILATDTECNNLVRQ